MGDFSWAFLVFLMKESKKRRRKQPGKLMAKSHSQPVNLPGAQPLMNPLLKLPSHSSIMNVYSLLLCIVVSGEFFAHPFLTGRVPHKACKS